MSQNNIETPSQMAPTDQRKKSEHLGRMSRSLSVWAPSRSMFVGRFCCCFSLQAGVCIYTSMGFVMMLCVIINNIGGEIHPLDEGYELIEFSILYIYALAMATGFSLAYIGSVKPSLKFLKIGNWVVVGFSAFWLIIACLSFIDDASITHILCIDRRCAETHWLVKTYFRTYGDDCILNEDSLLDDRLDDSYGDDKDKRRDNNEENTINHDNGDGGSGDDGSVSSHNGTQMESRKTKPNHTDAPYFDYDIDRPKPELRFNSMSNKTNEMDMEDDMLRSKLQLLRQVVKFESRIIGCAEHPNIYRTLSVCAMISWLIFMVNGIVGTFLLIKDVQRMAITGELNQALTHISYTQERQERQSRYMIS